MKVSKNLFILIGLFCSAILYSGAAQAQSMAHILPSLNKFNRPLSNQNTVHQTTSADLQTNFDNLIAKAQNEGTVRVIVGFRLENYRSDAELSNSAQTEQRETIKQKQTSLLNRLRDFDVKNARQFNYIPFMAIDVSADALSALRESGEITFIQENEMHSPSLVQSVPIIGGSPFGGATGGTFGGFSGAGRTVAILDTGVDKAHPFFNNRVVSEACYSQTTATTVSVCPGGASSSTASGSGVHCTAPACDHGTHVAGIAAGGNPLINGNGVARDANIIAVQVFSRLNSCTTNCTTAFTDDIIAGLERVYALRTTYQIDAVNMSLGSGQYSNYCDTQQATYKAAIDNLRSAGIATIIASGNDGFTTSISSPACVSTSFSVGSTNDGDAFPIDFVSTFSNAALMLNLLAPGELIISSVPGGFYDNKQGTSMAAPMIAGAWAVMKQKFPTDTIPQTYTRIRYSGVQVLDSRQGLVVPRLKLDSALNASNIDPCGFTTPISFGQNVNGSFLNTDCLMLGGQRADIYTFNGNQGQGIAITHSSTTFPTYLFLLDSNGNVVGQNGSGLTSRIPAVSGFLNLPANGTYRILATTVSGNQFGNYSLNLATNSSCNFTITSSSQAFASSGGAGNFNVNTTAGCAWTAQSDAAWLTTTSTGNGNGAVNYTVASNTSPSQRTATITAGGQVHTVTQAGAASTTVRAPFDFDGDNKTDLSIFRPAGGEWWYLKSSNGGNAAAQFGASTDKIVPGDYTGDQKSDFAFFRPSNGNWFVLRSENFTFYAFPFGTGTDTPVPADYDGDGKTDAAVFRSSNLTWYISKSSGGTDIIGFGAAGDKPVVADYDGDGKADIAIYRNNGGVSEWWIRRSSNGSVFATQFGNSTDKAVQGDYTGDGKADVAIFRPSNGNWFILRSENFSFYSFPFGANGDTPVAGDYDGDGRTDAGVFRATNTTWYIQRSTAGTLIQSFGINGDLAVPNTFVP